jgi:hypothetical protein
MNKLLVALLGILIFIVIVYAFLFGPLAPKGFIEGKVSIGPFQPVEPSNGSVTPPEIYLSRKVVLKPVLGSSIMLPLNGTGFFSGAVHAGSYTVTLTNCTFIGCSRSLPLHIEVKAGEVTKIVVDVDTGIR